MYLTSNISPCPGPSSLCHNMGTYGRLRDHTPTKANKRVAKWKRASLALIRLRFLCKSSCVNRASTICMWALQTKKHMNERKRYALRTAQIGFTHFADHFWMLSDNTCLSLFRFARQDIMRILPFFKWPVNKLYTTRNRYSVCPLLAT